MDEEEITAYHEAGHVVMALKLGGQIVHATLEPPNDDGLQRYGETVTSWRGMGRDSLLMAEIAVSVAGPISEMIYTGERGELSECPEWCADWATSLERALLLCSSHHAALKLIEKTRRQTETYFSTDSGWAAVAAIADLLLAHDTVEHDICYDEVHFWLPDH